MKKLLALTLAVAMVLSLASVAFAYRISDEDVKGLILADFPLSPVNHPAFPPNVYLPLQAMLGHSFFGNSLYYIMKMDSLLEDEEISFSDYKKEIKLSDSWEMGEEYVEGVYLKPIFAFGEPIFAIEIRTKDMPKETEEKDVIGTITLKFKKDTLVTIRTLDYIVGDRLNDDATVYAAPDFVKEYDFDVAFTLSNKSTENDLLYDVDETYDDVVVYDFDDGEEEQEINLYGNMGRFCVNTIGQGNLTIKTNVEINDGIEAIHKDSAYVYFNGNGAMFNKIGTLYLNASYGDHLYKVEEDGTLKELEGNYDTDEDAFKLRTRKLGSYVIAEKELDLEKINAAILSK